MENKEDPEAFENLLNEELELLKDAAEKQVDNLTITIREIETAGK